VVVRNDSEACLPQIGFTLTTRSATTPPATFRRDVEKSFRALRRQPWAKHARYLGQIEFTTGKGARSGGARRIHQHGLLKDVDREHAADVGEILRRVWKERTGAHRVEAHELHRPAGAIAYLVNHHQKSAQTPPRGWSGKRLRPSKGYYERPIGELREEARAYLADDRHRHAVQAVLERCGAWDELDPWTLEDITEEWSLRAAANPPELVRTASLPVAFDADGLPAAWELQSLGAVEDERAA
jgi:hypothetical protein